MDFSDALRLIKAGKRVARAGWNGKGMYVYLVQGSRFAVNRAPLNEHFAEGTEVKYLPHIDMKTANPDENEFVPWLASQTDILAEDWEVVEPS